MATRARVFDIDVRQLEGLAGHLGNLSGDSLAQASADALNKVIDETNQSVREQIVSSINLTTNYLADRLDVGHASKTLLEARIYAPYRNTSLGRYSALPITVAAKSPLKRLKGNAGLGIPKGQKVKQVSVEVSRGVRKVMSNRTAFMSPTLKNSDGDPMVFTTVPGVKQANGKNKLEARYGPAVYQLFRVARDNQFNDIAANLELTLLAEAEAAIDEAFQ